jgi:uncharacterized SAM-binding protein YcdF (DUF218 family)
MANQESIPLWGESRPDGDLVLVDRRRYVVRPRWQRRAFKVALAALAVAALVFVLFRQTWLRALGSFLVYSQAPRAADAIVVLAGGEGERSAKGAALYHEGYAPVVIASNPEYYDLCVPLDPATRLRADGVPAEAIYELDAPESTLDEALQARERLAALGAERAILVTSSYHSRRAYAIFSAVCDGIEFISVPVEPELIPFEPDAWWHDEENIKRAFEEYTKFAWFYLVQRGRIPELEE